MFVGQKVGPFEIEQELGSGAMGTVYRAKFEKDGKPTTVALKVVALGLLGNESAMARFEREANILKQLRHKHIVRLIATGKFGKSHPAPFIAMEYVDGEPLDRILARRGRMSWEAVVVYAKQLCEALQYAHEKGIIHRDLKPSNLMLSKDGVLKLTDFGIAKDVDVTALTGANSTIGTAAYMSPEQCKGDRNLSAKSDLYSLGVVMFELITGKKPFAADNTVDMFLKHVNEKPPRPTRFIPDLPIWLDNLIMFLLEKEKEVRPMDAATVRRMLEDIEHKVMTQQSAGAEIANARRADKDKFGTNNMNEEDIEAAKALRQSKGAKKVKKPKVVPFFQRQWVRAIPLAVVGLGLIGGLGYALWPKPKDFSADLAAMKAATGEQKVELAEAMLGNPAVPPDIAAEAKKVRRQARGERLTAVLEKRFANRNSGLKITKAQENEDDKAHDTAWQAFECEDRGELKKANDLWVKLKGREAEITDKYADGWGWLADQRLDLLKQVDATLEQFKAALAKAEVDETPWKPTDTEPEWMVRRAIRLGGFGGLPKQTPDGEAVLKRVDDPSKVYRIFTEMVDTLRAKAEKGENRLWFLIALREKETGNYPKTDDPKGRLKDLTTVVTTVAAEWKAVKALTDARAARRVCRNRLRDVIELYDDERSDEIKAIVLEAKKLLVEAEQK